MPDGGASIIAAITAVANAAAGAVASATFAVTGSAAIAGAASNFVIGALTLGGAGGGVAASIGAFAGQSALLAGISAMAPKPPVGRAQLQTSTGSTGPRKWVVGRCGVAGHLLTPTPMQSADGKIATQAYALSSSGPTGALAGLWFGDDFVTFQPNGVAITPKWSAALGCVSNTGTWTQPRLTLPSNHPSQWTVDHRAAGCATALFWIRTEAKEFQKNAPQQPRFLIVGNQAEVLDPRTGAAATYSSGGYNPACVAYTYLRGVWKDDILIQGFGIPDDEIDLDGYSYWADVCDTNGWRLAGEISAGDDRAAVLTAICAHGGAVPVPRAGLESVNVSAPGVSVVTLTDDDWVGLPELGSATEKFTLANQIIPRFAWENARFDLTDAEPIAPAAWLASDGGIERSTTFPLPWCTSLTQAGQIAAYAGYNDREPQQLVGTLKPSRRYSILPGDCFSWQSAELGVTIKFRLQAVTAIGEDLSIAIQAVTETDAKHALALGTTALPPARQAMPEFDTNAVITIADSYVPQPANLLPGAGPFIVPGDPDVGWLGQPGERWQIVESNVALLGQSMWQRALNGAAWDELLSPLMTFGPSETISATATLGRLGTWTAGDVGAAILYYDADGAPIGSPDVIGWALDGTALGSGAYEVTREGMVTPAGTAGIRFSLGVANGAGTGWAAGWRFKVNRGATSAPWSDEATVAWMWRSRIGLNILDADSAIVPQEQLLNTLVPRIEGPSSTTVQADFRGVALDGQLPRTLTIKLLRGSTDISESASWAVTTIGCTASVVDGAVTVTDVAGTGSISVLADLAAVPYRHQIEVVKINAAPPVTGGGGATTAVDTTISATGSTTLVTVGGSPQPLTVRAGAAGQIAFSAACTFTTAATSLTSAAMRIRYRAVGAGSWTWAAAEVSSTVSARGGTEPELGEIDASTTVTGLTSGTDYECELLARVPSGATVFFDGSFVAEAT